MQYCEPSKKHKYLHIHPAVVIGSCGAVVFLGLLISNFPASAQESKTVQVSPTRISSGNITSTASNSTQSLSIPVGSAKKFSPDSSGASNLPALKAPATSYKLEKSEKADNAGSVYRQVLPNGKILYTDHPVAGTKIDKTIAEESLRSGAWSALPDMQKPSPFVFLPSPVLKSADSQVVAPGKLQLPATELNNAGNQLAAEKNKLAAAEARLSAATLDLEGMDTPLENERSVNINGTSRLNERYFERQQAQRDEAQKAGTELDSALSAVSKAQSSERR